MAKFDFTVISSDLQAANFVGTDGQKTLVTKIVQALIQARLVVFGDGEYARITGEGRV